MGFIVPCGLQPLPLLRRTGPPERARLHGQPAGARRPQSGERANLAWCSLLVASACIVGIACMLMPAPCAAASFALQPQQALLGCAARLKSHCDDRAQITSLRSTCLSTLTSCSLARSHARQASSTGALARCTYGSQVQAWRRQVAHAGVHISSGVLALVASGHG